MKSILNLICMILVGLILLSLYFSAKAYGQEETYQQCRTRILRDIEKTEARTGKKVSPKNKEAALKVYCSRLKKKKEKRR